MFSVVSVHHSVHGGSHVTITHDALDITVQGLSPLPSPPPDPPASKNLVAITGNLFKLVHLRTHLNQYLHLVATKTCMVGKRAVRILLECFLVI